MSQTATGAATLFVGGRGFCLSPGFCSLCLLRCVVSLHLLKCIRDCTDHLYFLIKPNINLTELWAKFTMWYFSKFKQECIEV